MHYLLMKKLLSFFLVVLFFHFLSPPILAQQVCPTGDVKANWNDALGSYVYEYTDGSVTITGNDRCVYWQVQPGYTASQNVCIKYDGLTVSVSTSLGFWCTPNYDISHIVFYTDPTAVDITNFQTSLVKGRPQLDWTTASELDLLGFNIYRNTGPFTRFTKVNKTLISAQNPGSIFGANYLWTDLTSLRLNTTYYYLLEQVDIYGQTSQHGPVSIYLPSPFSAKSR